MGLESKSFLKRVEPYQFNSLVEDFVLDETTERRFFDYLTGITIIFTLSTRCKGCFKVFERAEEYLSKVEGATWIVFLECDDEDVPIVRQVIPSGILLFPLSRESTMQHMRVLGVPWVTILNRHRVVLHHPYDEEGMLVWLDQLQSSAGVT